MAEQKKTSWFVWGTAVFLLVLIGYPLIYGPVAKIVLIPDVHNSLSAETKASIWLFFYPLDIAFDRSPPAIRELYDAYFKLWNRTTLTELNSHYLRDNG